MSITETFSLESVHDGLMLSVLTVLPEQPPKVLVQFAHGMAAHKERYVPLMRFLAEHGCACVINDHRGHGASVKSPDDLGYFYKDGGRGLVRDLRQVTLWFRERFPGVPLALVGHSMGSFAAREYASKYGRDIDGMVLSGSPGYNKAAKMGLLLTRVVQLFKGSHGRSPLLDNMINGAFGKRFPASKFAWLSANPVNVTAYESDPLCGFPFTVNGYRALLHLMLAAYDTDNAIRRGLPVRFFSGEDDPCAPDRAGFDAAVENIRARGCTDVEAKMYPGLRHEIFNEASQEVWDDLLATLLGFAD